MGAFRKKHPLLKGVSGSLYDLPCPPNLSVFWNFGSLLGVFLASQILTGMLLASHYTPSAELAFSSIVHIMRDVEGGWVIRLIHANGASFFFLCLYVHIGRGMYYGSYLSVEGWNVGVLMLLLSMAIAFTGYVLPWGQMSYWGANVIINLFSAIPFVGQMLVEWLWGGYTVCNATLQRFFMLHFFMPFFLVFLAAVHLVFLHESGANNPLGVKVENCHIPFHPYYVWKDLLGFIVMWLGLAVVCCFWPFTLMDPTNFCEADSMVTPTHIQPEWYFLFAYTILRAVPNKAGGVLGLVLSVVVLFIVPKLHWGRFRSMAFYPICRVLFWCFVCNFVLLTWLGSCVVEEPYITASQVSSVVYFSYFFLMPVFMAIQDWMLSKSSVGL
uniref:cytochrome b n=1 Tax=Barbatia decussata TaxID=1508519 RepID=UPI00202884FE|nr:cytochrome b [Barbatia decussata]UQT65998.1 cytochrome b [Barbatia decussata]